MKKGLTVTLLAAGVAALIVANVTAPSEVTSLRGELESVTSGTPPRVVFFGDSYTDPNGSATWADLISSQNGWTGINLAYGGTGYLRKHTPPPEWGKCTFALGHACPSFADSVAAAGAANPDAIFILGGRNELGQEALPSWQAGVHDFFVALRAAAPRASIYAISPLWDDDPVPAGLVTMRNVVYSALQGLPGVCYADLYDPLLGHPEYVIWDGFHPSPAGHQAIVSALVQFLGRPRPGYPVDPVSRCGLQPPVPTRTR